MTKAKPSRYTVSSFGHELLQTLLKGSQERVEIPCPDQRTMKHIQMRLNMLRGAMFREQHPSYRIVTRARTSRTWDKTDKNKNCILIIQPNDIQFVEIFRAAGIVSHTPDDLLDGIENPVVKTEPEPEIDPYEKWKTLK